MSHHLPKLKMFQLGQVIWRSKRCTEMLFWSLIKFLQISSFMAPTQRTCFSTDWSSSRKACIRAKSPHFPASSQRSPLNRWKSYVSCFLMLTEVRTFSRLRTFEFCDDFKVQTQWNFGSLNFVANVSRRCLIFNESRLIYYLPVEQLFPTRNCG